MDPLQQAVCAGLTLAGCRIDATNQTLALDARTQYLGFAVWLHEQLDWLANAIYWSAATTRQKNPTYIVRSVAHPALKQYRDWRRGDRRPNPERTLTTMLTVRAWVARTAGVGWSGESNSRTTRFYAEDETTREWYSDILRYLGYDPYDSGNCLQLNQAESRDLFEAIGPPVPGVRHKWMFEKDAYETVRREQWIEQQDMADATLREGQLGTQPIAWERKYGERETLLRLRAAADQQGSLSAPSYQDWRSQAETETPSIGFLQNFAPWSVWCDLAGVSSTRRYRRQWTHNDFETAVQTAAEELGEPLASTSYADWCRGRDVPSLSTIRREMSWLELCRSAGVEPQEYRGMEYSQDDLIHAVIRIKNTLGDWPTSPQYNSHRTADEPSLTWLYEGDAPIESWDTVIQQAKSTE